MSYIHICSVINTAAIRYAIREFKCMSRDKREPLGATCFLPACCFGRFHCALHIENSIRLTRIGIFKAVTMVALPHTSKYIVDCRCLIDTIEKFLQRCSSTKTKFHRWHLCEFDVFLFEFKYKF